MTPCPKSPPRRRPARPRLDSAETVETLDEATARRAAALIEEAGGRTAALAEAHRHIAVVDTCLDCLPSAPHTADDLRALLSFLARREM
jgi:geranylgeranyl diphosphate synthase type I